MKNWLMTKFSGESTWNRSPTRSNSWVPNLVCRHPLRCQTQIQGVSDSFLGSDTKIRNLVPRNVCRDLNFDQLYTTGVSAINYRIDGGVSGQNQVGNPWSNSTRDFPWPCSIWSLDKWRNDFSDGIASCVRFGRNVWDITELSIRQQRHDIFRDLTQQPHSLQDCKEHLDPKGKKVK